MLTGDDRHWSPRYPAYVMDDVPLEDLRAVADAAVARVGGRGALGPVAKGAKVLIVSTEDQDEVVHEVIAEAMRKAGAASVTGLRWSSLGLPTGDFSAADGWRELSEAHLETTIKHGERVEQDALIRYLKDHGDFDALYAGDAGEGHFKMALGSIFRANWMFRKREDLIARYNNFPVQIQRLLESRLLDMFARASAVRITDPEGTDLGWDVTEEEAGLWKRGAWIPWHIIGTTIEGVRFAQVRPSFGGDPANSLSEFARIAKRHFPTINGRIAGTVNHTGFFPRLEVTIEGGKITAVQGGGEYGRRLEALIERYRDVQYPGYPSKGYQFINDATIGSNPKTYRTLETLWHTATPWYGLGPERYRAGVIHFGFGAEHEDPEFVRFGREHQVPIKHLAHIHAYFADYEIRDRASGEWFKVIDRGRLTVLDDPAVRRLASLITDPDALMAYDWVPAVPGINHPGDYAREFAADPVSWIRRDVAGEFGRAVR